MALWMISWWVSHLGRRPVQQWEVSRIAVWCVLAFWWASLLAWGVGCGFGLEMLWVQWLGHALGWLAPSVVERWVCCSVGKEMEGLWVGSLVGASDGL